MGGVCCCLSDPVDFNTEVTLYHFDLHRAVGKGAFGKVRIVERKDTGLTFALKYIRKDEGLSAPPPCRQGRAMLTLCHSRTVRKRPEYHSRAADARASQPPVPLQSALQLPGHRIPVRSATMKLRRHKADKGQIYCGRSHERRRPAIPHLEKDVHRGGRAVLDGRAWVCRALHPPAGHCAQRYQA